MKLTLVFQRFYLSQDFQFLLGLNSGKTMKQYVPLPELATPPRKKNLQEISGKILQIYFFNFCVTFPIVDSLGAVYTSKYGVHLVVVAGRTDWKN
jgi:hypothetical protein